MSYNAALFRKTAFVLCFFVIGIALCCLLQIVEPVEAGQTAEITASHVNARLGPGTNYTIVGEVNLGEKYPVLAKEGEWYKLQLKNGTAWVAGWLLKVKDESAGYAVNETQPNNSANSTVNNDTVSNNAVCTAVVNATNVNLRFGPGTSYKIIGQVDKGDSFPVLAKSGEWYKIKITGGTAWVAGWLLDIKNEPGKKQETGKGQGLETGKDIGNKDNGTSDQVNSSRTAVVNANYVNVRSGPGTNYRVIAMVNKGEKYTVSGRSGEWYKLELARGSGWVAGWLLVLSPEASRGGSFESPGGQPEPGTGENGKLTMEVSQVDDKAVISLKSAGKIDHNIFTLTNPHRLVMDLTLEDYTEDPDKKLPTSVEVNKGPVSALRTGWLDSDHKCLRIVLDLKDRAHYMVTELNGEREIVLEVFVPNIKNYLQGKTIFLDPGHGGYDPGAIGPTGLYESNVTLDIASKAAELLREQGAAVYMSRTGNSYVGLKERAYMANNVNADVFVSIHINSNRQPDKWGMSTYYYSPPVDTPEQAQQRKKMANSLQTELSEALQLANLGLFQAEFVVLRETIMPAVLLEIGFISNPEEEKLLREDSFREQAAQAITRGLGYYFCS